MIALYLISTKFLPLQPPGNGFLLNFFPVGLDSHIDEQKWSYDNDKDDERVELKVLIRSKKKYNNHVVRCNCFFSFGEKNNKTPNMKSLIDEEHDSADDLQVGTFS